MYHIVKYKDTRNWAVLHHNGKLLAVVVYKKGAEAIVQALEQILIAAVSRPRPPSPCSKSTSSSSPAASWATPPTKSASSSGTSRGAALVLLPFTKKKRKIPGLNIHLADSMILAQLLQAIYNLIARR